ncbi:myosin heavy chain, embryonic smooth muscle isoform isoform X7 [Salmo salar]|uniref:Myosin heavy chain, embryonic smooth muscle isoform isoform X7 n=1 Tax=Salmo salar TaxID=8030 RepID=A0A1S3P2C2_SALSA|nr:myosin heavy chain, embryonic smooth muscle isoform isoform X7 [Salmo salar]|eukprot:XP_014021754.1 PREDICTED: myosin heavy chain, embryonic smooth muscle isoform-like isoform X6 [Salmo salar]
MEDTEQSEEEQKELELVVLCLQEEGMAPGASVKEQLGFLWRLFQHSEGRLVAVTHDLDSLRARHSAEMAEVQRYLEHIRSLSEKRDALAQEYEQENEVLRAQLQRLTLQQDAQMNEVAEMLYQEGLAEVIPSSHSEQVAYLLVERASLLERPNDPQVPDAQAGTPSASQQETQSQIQCPKESMDQGAPSRGQSPWKRLFGLRKAAQSKQALASVELRPGSGLSVEQEWARLERDLEEASRRLAMAHREIRRLTDELESAHMTQSAYEPELQGAQEEVEQLRQEVEKLKKCDVVELRKAKELNDRLDQEIRALRTRVRTMDAERKTLLETVEKMKDSDNAAKTHPEALQLNLAKGEGIAAPQMHTVCLQTELLLLDQDKTHERRLQQSETKDKLNDVRRQLQGLQEKYDELMNVTKKAEEYEDYEELKKQREEEEKVLELLMDKTEVVEGEYEELKTKKEEMEEEYEELKTKKEEVERVYEELKTKKEEVERVYEELKTKKEEVERVYEELKTKMDEEKKEYEHLENMREELKLDEALGRSKQQQQHSSQAVELQFKVCAELKQGQAMVSHLEQRALQQENRELREGLAQSSQKAQSCSHLQEELSAERAKLKAMEVEIQGLQQQLKSTEHQLNVERNRNTESGQQEEEARYTALRTQENQLHRRMWEQREEELQEEGCSLREVEASLNCTNSELSRRFRGQQTHRDVLQSQTATARQEIPADYVNLKECLEARQEDCEKLTKELMEVLTCLDLQKSKNAEKRSQHKAKMRRAKQIFLKETGCRDERIQSLERDLALALTSSAREKEMIVNMKEENGKLLAEKRDLLGKLNDVEEKTNKSVLAATTTQCRNRRKCLILRAYC